ncbi:beta-L-arabinofuranosidase domain-containing protein [Paenibacillus sanguinis]|uniref:beta-L-arabinofuranosidase domain-containing protein n=1 Tax=Paenibacillus sanguinis TaxID=225906 RepID=UPI00036DD918|nr:beta-L-arabinofuranosidase domain-containing protein [Paenibacillus sanguinis]
MDRNAARERRLEIARLDCEGIYIGNLYTVDTDLQLPVKGQNGSIITWESRETLFISHTGKVTRPSHGVGNRIIPLVATVTYEGESVQKTFEATVLEEEYKAEIVEVYPVDLRVQEGEVPQLPGVVVVRNDTGSRTVHNVVWEKADWTKWILNGRYIVKGRLENSNWETEAKITVVEAVDQLALPQKKVHVFNGQSVSLEPGTEFADAMDRSLEYICSVDDDQMLYNFRIAAGLDVKGAKPMTGWDAPECNLKGHTTGHYLSALALAYHATGGSEAVKAKIEYMIEQLDCCQQAMSAMPGVHSRFLSAYSEEQFDLLEQYSTYPTIWAPYYTLHKIMAGLLECYVLAGQEAALQICARLGDWVHHRLSRLSQEQLQRMWSLYIAGEFGGMNEVMTQLYLITNEAHYVEAAKYFDNEKLLFPMQANMDTLGDMHANQHIPQIIGALKLYEAEGNAAYYEAAKNFWRMVIEDHAYSIGGVGETEMFREPGKIAAYLTDKTAETCASYNMLKLTRELYSFEPKPEYMDYYERTLYNHILATENNQCAEGGSTYFLPLAPGSCKKFDTHENTCCHGTGLENHFKYQESIYFHDGDTLYVNLYIPSILEWEEQGITLSQTRKREKLADTAAFILSGGREIRIHFRIPEWIKGLPEVTINGKRQQVDIKDGYLVLQQAHDGDRIELLFPYAIRWMAAPDDARIKSVCYGPYIMAALHEGQQLLTWSCSTEEFVRRLEPSMTGPEFTVDGIRFVPLHQVHHERYHTYFRFEF